MPVIHALPEQDDDNGWERTLPARGARPALARDLRCDWLVIGAGLAGLAAARRLAQHRPQASIVLLEAGHVGAASSGRNSGFLIDLAHNVGGVDHASLHAARAAMRVSRAALNHLEEVCRRHGIDCHWLPAGQYMPAVSRRGMAVLDDIATQLEALDEPFSRLDREQLADETGTGYYRGALHTPGTVLLQPVALVHGLADTLPANVSLYENSPVRVLDCGARVRAQTAAGTVDADGVIVAVNGLAGQFGCYRDRLINLRLFASLSETLTSADAERMNVAPWGMVPALAFGGPTLRYTADHRLLVRYDIRYAPHQASAGHCHPAVAASHLELLHRRFPQLESLRLAHTWSGYITVSANFAPGLGQHARNVFSAVCHNGLGLSKGTMSGLLAADLACGEDNPLLADMLAPGTPARLPPRPLLDWGARFKLWRWRLAARAER